MKRLLSVLLPMVTAGGLLAACGGGAPAPSRAPSTGGQAGPAPAAPPAAKPNTLTAIKVDAAPLDANANVWANAPRLEVAAKAAKEGNPDGPAVVLQAVYDNESIAIRAEWADPTESILKNAWTWDGTAFKKSSDEDRLMFAWPIGNNAEFASKGCGAACHNTDPDPEKWWMGSTSADVRYDNWHWKSTRTHPAGYADDQWWNILEDPNNPSSSRRNDAKESGGYADNVNDAKTGPKFMSSKGVDVKFIFKGEEVELDTTKLSPGAVIPGYILSKAVGSRGDVEASGAWADGKWVVVMKRALNTGYEDDATFTPPKPVPFGLAVVDNGGGLEHAVVPDVLTLEWK